MIINVPSTAISNIYTCVMTLEKTSIKVLMYEIPLMPNVPMITSKRDKT
jgi:hypothetical protein